MNNKGRFALPQFLNRAASPVSLEFAPDFLAIFTPR